MSVAHFARLLLLAAALPLLCLPDPINHTLRTIIFTRDRAAQLDLLLRSMDRHFPEWKDPGTARHSIVACVTAPHFGRAYLELEARRGDRPPLNVVWEHNDKCIGPPTENSTALTAIDTTTSFEELVLSEMAEHPPVSPGTSAFTWQGTVAPLTLMLVDDTVFRGDVDLESVRHLFASRKDVISVSCGLWKGITSSYMEPEGRDGALSDNATPQDLALLRLSQGTNPSSTSSFLGWD